jgi:hypothetical protein
MSKIISKCGREFFEWDFILVALFWVQLRRGRGNCLEIGVDFKDGKLWVEELEYKGGLGNVKGVFRVYDGKE